MNYCMRQNRIDEINERLAEIEEEEDEILYSDSEEDDGSHEDELDALAAERAELEEELAELDCFGLDSWNNGF